MSNYFQTIYSDPDILVINKPAGLIVESKNKSDLTLEKILERDYKINLPRSGIVHRLDRFTSGLIVIAKSEKALVNLQNQFASHQVKKVYSALVYGKLEPKKGTINLALKRDPKNRTRFVASRSRDAKEAITHYEVVKPISLISHISSTKIKAGADTTLLRIELLTGRTHQIRAHLFAIGFPVIGDQVYKTPLSQEFSKKIGLNHQFLHAGELSFKHPVTGKKMEFKAELPSDLKQLI